MRRLLVCRRRHLLFATTGVMVLAACAHQPTAVSGSLAAMFGYSTHVPGFFSGLWHGVIAPFAFIGSIFTDIRMYAFPNGGVLYDLGFLLGIAVWGGGAAASR